MGVKNEAKVIVVLTFTDPKGKEIAVTLDSAEKLTAKYLMSVLGTFNGNETLHAFHTIKVDYKGAQ